MIVQTFGFEEMPEAVSLDTAEFIDLGDGRTRLELLSVVYSMEAGTGCWPAAWRAASRRGTTPSTSCWRRSRGVTIPSEPAAEHRSIAARSPNGSAEGL